MSIHEAISSIALKPQSCVTVFCERYEAYAKAYTKNPAVCGREKLLLFQSAYYFDEVLTIKVEGIEVALLLASGEKFCYPRD